VGLAFGPSTATFAKWLHGRRQEGLETLHEDDVQPENLKETSLIYSYKSPASLKRLPGAESLGGQLPLFVYQPWRSIAHELVSGQLKWKAKHFCRWAGWASRSLEVLEETSSRVIEVLTPDDFAWMMKLFPQKSARRAAYTWMAQCLLTGQTLVRLGLKEKYVEGFQTVLLP